MTVKPATLTEISKYFGYDNIAAFRKDWVGLTDTEKDQIKNGIGDGTLNY